MVSNMTNDKCDCMDDQGPCCNVEAVVSVDDRGQMVLPKDVREKMGLQSGEKLAIAIWQSEGEPCCALLVKAQSLTGMMNKMLGPLAENITQEGKK